MIPLANAHPNALMKTRHNPRTRKAPIVLVRGTRINAPPAISAHGRKTDKGGIQVSGIKVNGASARANCALLEALTTPE